MEEKTVSAIKIGNSLAVLIPAKWVHELGIEKGDKVTLNKKFIRKADNDGISGTTTNKNPSPPPGPDIPIPPPPKPHVEEPKDSKDERIPIIRRLFAK